MTTDQEATDRANADEAGRCPVCRAAIADDEQVMRCPACQTAYHQDCWSYNNGCGIYGCADAATTEGLESVEIPPAYWGQEEKVCPVCDAKILAAALRCRNCGTTFASARPQDRQDYRAEGETSQKLLRIRRTSIWLLIFGLLPCTAPLVAIGGSIWYAANRSYIRRLPGTPAAVCVIAVGAACLQTLVMIIAAVILPAASG
jgi:ribosomal protein L40E